MSKAQRRKGHDWERLCANELQTVYPEAKRGIGQARDSREVPDVDCTPFWVECKVGKRVDLHAAVKQANEARDDRPLLVLSKRDGETPLATMEMETLLELLGLLDRKLARWPFWGREA